MKSQYCPVCNKKKYRSLFKVLGRHGRKISNEGRFYLYSRCNSCKTVYLDKRKLDKNSQSEFYGSEYYKREGVFQRIIESFLTDITNKIQRRVLSSCLKDGKNRKAILDIGCGEGNFLKGLKTQDFVKYGLDLKSNKVNNLDGIDVYKGDFLKIKFDRKFDVVVLLHVLEHLEDPVKVLKKIKRLLNPKGIVLLSTPNTDSIGFRLGGQNWFHLDPPYHMVLFNKDNMKLACEKTGFIVLSIKNDFYQFPLDLYWSLKSVKDKYLYYLFYPIMKIVSKECLTYVIVKNEKD